MCQQQWFKWLEVWCLVEHYASPLKVGLSKWKFSIKFQDLENLNFENIFINSNLNQIIWIKWEEMVSI
jgi:hypothetical protein